MDLHVSFIIITNPQFRMELKSWWPTFYKSQQTCNRSQHPYDTLWNSLTPSIPKTSVFSVCITSSADFIPDHPPLPSLFPQPFSLHSATKSESQSIYSCVKLIFSQKCLLHGFSWLESSSLPSTKERTAQMQYGLCFPPARTVCETQSVVNHQRSCDLKLTHFLGDQTFSGVNTK